jgi:hypothetical protein
MAIFDLFSKRQKKLRGEVPDVYQYEDIPNELRIQIVHIIRDTLGIDRQYSNKTKQAYRYIKNALCREYGVFDLTEHARSDEDDIFNFFLDCDDYEQTLDVVELAFQYIDSVTRKPQYFQEVLRKCEPNDAINELNARFKEHGVGYQYETGQLVKIDSQLIHAEVVKPALLLLRSDKCFKGANDEFLKAHEHYVNFRTF